MALTNDVMGLLLITCCNITKKGGTVPCNGVSAGYGRQNVMRGERGRG